MVEIGRSAGIRSVRVRILGSMLLVAALGLSLAAGVSYFVQRERIQTQVDEQLEGEIENLRGIAEGPEGGEPPATVSDLLLTAIQRIVPGPTESTLGFVNGRPAFFPASDLAFRIDEHPDLVTRLLAEADDQDVVRGTARTDDGLLLRYVIVPVSVSGDSSAGLYVAAIDLGAEFDRLAQGFRAYAWTAGGALVVLGLVGWFVAGRLLRPLSQLQSTAAHASEFDLSERVKVVGRDDVSDLARTVNGMLDRLQASFGAQRRLLDDVGHELRTPITIVRGHLELLDPSNADEVRATRDLTLDELDRMSLLVEDVVLLARAGQPDFVTPVPVDIAALTESVRAKAAGLSPDHEWRAGVEAPVIAPADVRRITEAWLQLAENAAKYAPPGSPITIGSSVTASGSEIELWVSDSGPGVPAEDRQRLFERFARAEQGRGIEGSGLGLSIVDAIATAHGGHARLDDAAGGGTLAVISLPFPRSYMPAIHTPPMNAPDDVPDDAAPHPLDGFGDASGGALAGQPPADPRAQQARTDPRTEQEESAHAAHPGG